MRVFRMRNFGLFSLFIFVWVAFTFGAPGSSNAGIPVFDGTNLTQNLISAIQNVMSVINEATQITNQATQISNQVRSLTTLGPAQYATVNALAATNISDLNGLVGSATNIKFNASTVSSEFDNVFLQGTNWSTIPISSFNPEFDKWTQNLFDSAKLSMQAQTIINRVRSNYTLMRNILSQSNGADGEVRQIAAANQSLGVVSSQLGDITQTLVASQRVTATAAAVAAAEKKAKMEASIRLRNGYTNTGPTPPKLASLPTPK